MDFTPDYFTHTSVGAICLDALTPHKETAMSMTTTDIDFAPSEFEQLAGTTVGGEDSLDEATWHDQLKRLARSAPIPSPIDPDSWMYELSDDEFDKALCKLAAGEDISDIAIGFDAADAFIIANELALIEA